MEPRRIAAAGLGLVALMQTVFVVTGGSRGPLYVAVNALGIALAATAVAGAWRFPAAMGLRLLGIAFAGQAVLRLLNVVLELTRLPFWESAIMLTGWAIAGASALAWSFEPARPRAGLRAGLYVVGAAYFAALLTTLGSGYLPAIFALLVGTIGVLLAAPWLRLEN